MPTSTSTKEYWVPQRSIPHNAAINIAEGGSITLDELLSATVVIEETNLENVSKRKNIQE